VWQALSSRKNRRPTGWHDLAPVVAGEMHEIKSAVILNPGPVAIREGLPTLHRLIANWAAKR